MNRIIHERLHTSNPLMNEVVETYLRTKGKQIRPILVLLSAKLLGEVNDHVLYAGASLEMLHNASLIHDDVVDDTRERRGRPTLNTLWDNHIAVLVGDFFVSTALEAGIATERISIIRALSDLGKELSLGEIDQINNARGHLLDEEGYYSVIQKKTASLFMNCVRMGAEAGGATEERIRPIEEYARLLGLCFQIKDDIFDYFDQGIIGKPTGNDLREGKVTLPLLYAVCQSGHAEAANARDVLVNNDELTDNQIAGLIDFAKRAGGIEYAYEAMRRMQVEADDILRQYPDNEARQAFAEIFEYIISRDH